MNDNIKISDTKINDKIFAELNRQRNTLEMIASENFVSKSVMEVTGSVLTNKYAEGYPNKRYYGGCDVVDEIETLAINRVKKLFNSQYANVQPHSGSQANMAVYQTFLSPKDTVLGLDLAHGGHLTHGSLVNFSGKLYNFVSYGICDRKGTVNFDEVYKQAILQKPKMIICGGSAYPRFIEFQKFRAIADEVGAFLMADIAHPSGLIAAGLHPSPWPFCHIATSTTHKTLRGPRGGLILMGEDFENTWKIVAPKSGRVKLVSELIDSAVMPGIQGGPLMHVIAGKAVAFKEALSTIFIDYCKQVVSNAKCFAENMIGLGYNLVSGGTDTHLVLIDLTDKGISGKDAEILLEKAGITTNKNMVPFDKRGPLVTSGIRIGTPALTSRGMGNEEMKKVSDLIHSVLSDPNNKENILSVKQSVREICSSFPLYEELYK